jgi:hypothetical protein
MRAASAGVATPPAAKFTTGRLYSVEHVAVSEKLSLDCALTARKDQGVIRLVQISGISKFYA